ncbi:MAG TPA: hypothetical protein PKC76_16340 [Saprospiraceae bacterium]|nr:hypothetical protein [Saprospiraceae bacterium]HMP25702.1 hypothetical protein [Saprospiraceae bacterium]
MQKFLTTFLISMPLLLFAQRITISEDIPLRSEVAYEIIGSFKDRILLFRDRVTEFEIQAFNHQMRESWSKKLNLEKRSPKVLGFVASDTDFTLIYRYRDRNHTIVKAHRYDPAANLRDTFTIKDFGFLFYTPNFQLIRSEDKSKVLIYYVENQSVFRAISYDAIKMEVLWEKSFAPENMNFWEDFQQALVTDTGDMYVVLTKNRLRYRKDDHYYEVFQLDGTPQTPLRYHMPVGGEKTTYDVRFVYDNRNDQLVGAGLFSDKNPERAAGYFYIRSPLGFDSDFLFSFDYFDDEFIASLAGKAADNKGILEIVVQDVVLRRDGGAVLVCERARELMRAMGSPRAMSMGVRQIVDHYHDDAFVISIHPDGRTHWRTILYKKQYSQDDNGIYSSFFLFKSPTNIRLLFNDEVRFENTVSEYIVYGNGSFDRKSLMSTANLDLRLRFRDAIQLSSDEVVIPSERRNRLKLVRLQYEEGN